jgi:hypothetical protein
MKQIMRAFIPAISAIVIGSMVPTSTGCAWLKENVTPENVQEIADSIAGVESTAKIVLESILPSLPASAQTEILKAIAEADDSVVMLENGALAYKAGTTGDITGLISAAQVVVAKVVALVARYVSKSSASSLQARLDNSAKATAAAFPSKK